MDGGQITVKWIPFFNLQINPFQTISFPFFYENNLCAFCGRLFSVSRYVIDCFWVHLSMAQGKICLFCGKFLGKLFLIVWDEVNCIFSFQEDFESTNFLKLKWKGSVDLKAELKFSFINKSLLPKASKAITFLLNKIQSNLLFRIQNQSISI